MSAGIRAQHEGGQFTSAGRSFTQYSRPIERGLTALMYLSGGVPQGPISHSSKKVVTGP